MTRRLAIFLGVILVTLVAVSSVSASSYLTFGSRIVPTTKNNPITLSVTTGSVGELHVYAYWTSGKGVSLTVSGPASCSDSQGRYPEVFCTVPDAPVGTYQITVSVKGNSAIWINGWVEGEIVGYEFG
jgi:hypothetical protein